MESSLEYWNNSLWLFNYVQLHFIMIPDFIISNNEQTSFAVAQPTHKLASISYLIKYWFSLSLQVVPKRNLIPVLMSSCDRLIYSK